MENLLYGNDIYAKNSSLQSSSLIAIIERLASGASVHYGTQARLFLHYSENKMICNNHWQSRQSFLAGVFYF